jgi:hypothetical protein
MNHMSYMYSLHVHMLHRQNVTHVNCVRQMLPVIHIAKLQQISFLYSSGYACISRA